MISRARSRTASSAAAKGESGDVRTGTSTEWRRPFPASQLTSEARCGRCPLQARQAFVGLVHRHFDKIKTAAFAPAPAAQASRDLSPALFHKYLTGGYARCSSPDSVDLRVEFAGHPRRMGSACQRPPGNKRFHADILEQRQVGRGNPAGDAKAQGRCRRAPSCAPDPPRPTAARWLAASRSAMVNRLPHAGTVPGAGVVQRPVAEQLHLNFTAAAPAPRRGLSRPSRAARRR